MAGCCGNSTPDNTIWTVTSPDGKITKDVIGEQNAIIERTRNGGGTIKKKSS